MKTALLGALMMFALAGVIALGVSVLIKLLFAVIRRVNGSK